MTCKKHQPEGMRDSLPCAHPDCTPGTELFVPSLEGRTMRVSKYRKRIIRHPSGEFWAWEFVETKGGG